MSVENAKKLIAKFEEDEAFGEKAEGQLEGLNDEETVAKFVELGAAENLEFTADEFKEATTPESDEDKAELDDEDMEEVAGGRRIYIKIRRRRRRRRRRRIIIYR